MVIRLFKRFYFRTIEKKYGYFKPNINLSSDPPEISGSALCSELEINPKILRLAGIFTTLGGDAMISWIDFVRIISMFLLRKPILELRYKLILNFLDLKDDYKRLEYDDYM